MEGTGVPIPPGILKTSLGGLVLNYYSENSGSPLFLGTTSVSSLRNFRVSMTRIE
jgi:hypothetical protein